MGENENEKTKPQSQSEGLVATPSSSEVPTPPEQFPLHKVEEPKSPHNSSSSPHTLMSHLIPIPNLEDQGTSPIVQNAGFARVEEEKRLSLIKAWEENEKTKVENRASKRQSSIGFWEDSKKASVEANLKKFEEKLERKKAEYVEKMQNKIAEIHLKTEERKAMVKAKREEGLLKVEEIAAKFRSSGGYSPRKLFPCFGGRGFST